MVLAETREQADYARSLIRATYEEPAVIDFDEAIKNAREPKHILGEPPIVKESDAEAALSSAPHRVDAVFRTPRHNHNAIELHAVTLFWEDGALLLMMLHRLWRKPLGRLPRFSIWTSRRCT